MDTKPAPKKPIGRPKATIAPRAPVPVHANRYELQDEIVAWLSDGKPLAAYCRQNGKPRYRVVYDWLAEDADFATRVARAREMGFDAIAEEALQIADMPLMGIEETISPDGLTIKKADMLGHRKLQIETRLKLLACWDPKRYGPRQILAGDDKNPLKAEVSFGVFDELLTALTLKRHGASK